MSLIKTKPKAVVTLFTLSLLIITAVVGTTIAFIIDKTQAANNSFNPVLVDTTPFSSSSEGIAVINNGDIPAYIRATVIVNWVAVDENGNPTNHFLMDAPKEGIDYTITYDNTDSWIRRSDGFWYYKAPVPAATTTNDLVLGITRLSAPPEEGYMLFLEVATTGIQSAPSSVVENIWGVTLNDTNIIS